MSLDPKLENYLARLDKALAGVAVGDRADIVTEIKSHVLSVQEQHPERKLTDILEALGEPEAVANRYLMEKGLKPGKPARGPMAKWLVIGFLGTLAILVLFAVFVVTKFTPIVEVNEKEGRVKILGGLIDVGEDQAASFVDQFENIEDRTVRRIEGSRTLDAGTREVKLRFSNGKIDLMRAEGSEIKWACKLLGATENAGAPEFRSDLVAFNFEGISGVECDVWVPAGKAIDLSGSNGKVYLNEIESPARVSVDNAKILIKKRPGVEYRFETSVVHGAVDDLGSSTQANALPIILKVSNGKISKE